ncbi:hypothetical protein HOY82DRAFT_647040 [Tuber indicum]|nr:hypothetical protein HOY82DRAFT_647040 [Tuber indicum]
MSQVGDQHSLFETFDSLVEHQDILSPDSEFFISLIDNNPGCSGSHDPGIDLACPRETNSLEGGIGPRCCASPESSQIDGTQRNVVPQAVNKKRKSWGDELPAPTTHLPPRKRAKTDAEKEQRRIERILRNRASARSARERKQKEVESLENERRSLAECNADLRVRLAAVEESNRSLRQQLAEMQEMLKRYQEHVKVVASDVAVNVIRKPADPTRPTPFWGAPEPTVNELKYLCQVLDTIEAAPATTIGHCVLEESVWPGWGETITSRGYCT